MTQFNLNVVQSPQLKREISISINQLNIWFGNNHILKNCTLNIQRNSIHCIIGPSGSGKTTFLRSINKMHPSNSKVLQNGTIDYLELRNIEGIEIDNILREKIGMVFQKPCVYPKSIMENLLFGISVHKKLSKLDKIEITERYLKSVGLWEEVKHRLDSPASSLSTGQQQRLCIARSLAIEPKILLLDEPTSALDPQSAKALEELMLELKKEYTIILVTHNLPQARRVGDFVSFMCDGQILETGPKQSFFNNPLEKSTKEYLCDETCEC